MSKGCEEHGVICQKMESAKHTITDHESRIRNLEGLSGKIMGMGAIIMIEIPIALFIAKAML